MELKNLGQTAASALIHMDIRLEREHWTMFRQKLLGIAAAATLGSAAMLGSTAAYAVKICDSGPTARTDFAADSTTCFDSVTFAAETLLMGDTNVQAASDESDTTTYYNINDELFLGAPTDIGAAAGDAYIVSIVLEGMVFRSASASLGNRFTPISGGGMGDNSVVFRLTPTGTLDATTGVLSLDADFAVSADGGSATLTMTNQSLQGLNLPGVSGTKEHKGTPIMIASALNEVSTKMTPTAEVADGFLNFKDERTTASLGTVMLGVKEMHRQASDGANVDALEDIMLVGDNTETPAAPNSTVSFSGDFSFASKVFLHGDDDCGAATGDAHINDPNTDPETAADATDILMMEGEGDDAVVAGTTSAVTVGTTGSPTFDTAQHLCIMVADPTGEDAKRIPATSAYTAMGSYKGLADAAIGPMPEEQTLGMIERNGVTVVIPYLTTNEDYNQWLVMVNSGTAPARYEMTFTTAEGDTTEATPGVLAEGMLEPGTTVLSLRNDDVVGLVGRQRVSAEIVLEAQPQHISIATHQRNLATGGTDTVTYSSGQ